MVRKEMGESHTGFERVHDGVRRMGMGDVVRLATKPQLVGRVRYFSVPQVGGRACVACDMCRAGQSVCLRAASRSRKICMMFCAESRTQSISFTSDRGSCNAPAHPPGGL